MLPREPTASIRTSGSRMRSRKISTPTNVAMSAGEQSCLRMSFQSVWPLIMTTPCVNSSRLKQVR